MEQCPCQRSASPASIAASRRIAVSFSVCGDAADVGEARDALEQADVVLSLDWVDLGGTLRAVFGTTKASAKVMHASLDHRLHGGWSMDYQTLPEVDLLLPADPDLVVEALLELLQAHPAKSKGGLLNYGQAKR